MLKVPSSICHPALIGNTFKDPGEGFTLLLIGEKLDRSLVLLLYKDSPRVAVHSLSEADWGRRGRAGQRWECNWVSSVALQTFCCWHGILCLWPASYGVRILFPKVDIARRPGLSALILRTPLELSHTLCSVNVYRPIPWDSDAVIRELQGHAGMSLSGLTLLTLFMWSNEYIPAEYAHASNVLHPRKG